jgi:hypothetical protein
MLRKVAVGVNLHRMRCGEFSSGLSSRFSCAARIVQGAAFTGALSFIEF